MISYSFYKVYGPPSKTMSLSHYQHQQTENEHGCCQRLSAEDKAAQHAQTLKRNRMIVWASLGVALAGASYGRFPAASSRTRTILQSSVDHQTKKNLMFFSELPNLSHLWTGSSSSKSPPTAAAARNLLNVQDDGTTTTKNAGTTAATDAAANQNAAVVSWHVEGMHCGGCARNLQRILEVQGSLMGEEGWDEAAVRTAILNLGYTVSDDVDGQ
jgi:hypothetical protein